MKKSLSTTKEDWPSKIPRPVSGLMAKPVMSQVVIVSGAVRVTVKALFEVRSTSSHSHVSGKTWTRVHGSRGDQ